MVKFAVAFLVTGLCMAFMLPPAFTATAPSVKTDTQQAALSQVPMSTVIQNLRINGYEIVKKIELDNGVFAIDAMTPQGKPVAVLMNAHTGEITQPKQNPAPRVSLEDAIKRVEGSGYHDIYQAEYHDGKYIVRAYDQKNKKVKLKVNGATGEIATSWFNF